MVLIGGYTRLSGSGLSMVDWSVQGNWLPLSSSAWETEFARYKEYPEFKKTYAPSGGMSMSEFQRIYFVEWFHRQFGRFTGLFFCVPFLGLTAAGVLQPPLVRSLGVLGGLGLCQGLVGWWMVQSGLKDDLLVKPDQPRVSPYRMAFHWLMALTLVGRCAWLGLAAAPVAASAAVSSTANLRRALRPVLTFAGLTLASAPFVAGNDAGRSFNRWPLMTETSMVPDEVWRLFDGPLSFSPARVFEDSAVVQFAHRTFAYGTALSALAFAWHARLQSGLSARIRTLSTRALPAVALAQLSLGVITLLMYVPWELGLAHQAGGLAVFGTLGYLRFLLRK